MLRSYLRLVLFTAGLLIGVQIPGFISDYSKRVEAHLIEAQKMPGRLQRHRSTVLQRGCPGADPALPQQ